MFLYSSQTCLGGHYAKTLLDFQFSSAENNTPQSSPGTALSPSLELLSSTRLSSTRPFGAQASLRVSVPVELIERYVEDWISEAEYLQRSPATVTGKKDALAKFLWWLHRQHCDECSTRELRHFLAYVGNGHLQPGGRWGNPQLTKAASPRTVQYYFNYLRGFFRWMLSENLIEDDPCRGLAIPKYERNLIQPFTQEQVGALLDATKRLTNPTRDLSILTFMLDTGLRASEFCNLKMSDLELHTSYGHATVIGKGRKKRTVPFSQRAARDLWHYLRKTPGRSEHCPVFCADRGNGAGLPLTRSGLQQLYERLGVASGIRGARCSPHTMRHTFAVSFLRDGGNVFTLQMILGHSDLKMTQRYVALSRADISDQHRRFSPADRIGKTSVHLP